MANAEHLAYLILGVDSLNAWRKERLEVRLDLRGARIGRMNLSGMNLSDANLSDANLRDVNLRDVNLRDVNLRDANLRGTGINYADLRDADLSGADLRGADLSDADLSDADLSDADLSDADLSDADLSGADLSGANLSDASLNNANLKGANLSSANLGGARLFSVNFVNANLINANLSVSYLTGADLTGADLRDANLFGAGLMHTDFSSANLTGIGLYGTGRDDWRISGVKCAYVYFDMDRKKRTPGDRDFEEGEFEHLYQIGPAFVYQFLNGMTELDPIIMNRVAEAIKDSHPEFGLRITNIDVRGAQPEIRFEVDLPVHKKAAEEAVRTGYESKIIALEAERDLLQAIVDRAIDRPGTINNFNAEGNLTAFLGDSPTYT